uniref:Uncharacterized protein n=1 Tax=Arundo donax TaxID=35708 RepID=A0A0A8Y8A8_ARUDO
MHHIIDREMDLDCLYLHAAHGN